MPKVAERLRLAYISRGILGTAAIEGNTLTQEQVEQQLQGTLELPPSQEYLGREIENLQRAYTTIHEGIYDADRQGITEPEIKEFNRIILDGLPPKPDVVPGEYAIRQHGVGTYRAPTPAQIRELMPLAVEWLNHGGWDQEVGPSPLVTHILRAILAHLYLAWIHPFGDGNGRTARMVEADLLARAGVPAIAYHLLSTHYNQTRTEYYRVLALTSATPGGDPGAFIRYALQGLADGLRHQIKDIKRQHREIVWRDYVHDCFRNLDTERYTRLRKLAMDLAEQQKPVPKAALWRISDRVTEAYRDRTLKTVSRDVTELLELGLIRRVEGGYVANTEQLEAFVAPFRSDDQPLERRARKKLTRV
jgi:Fic family protein